MARLEWSEHNRLHLIRASAGSGKTHRLTGEFLNLLFASPLNYTHILAVTFTNKATDEMKSRIVSELHNLAVGGDSDYLARLMGDFDLTEVQVRQQAKRVLTAILHDYSSFSISTIDRFFQQTMRAFAREMGLSGGYNVEVDDRAFLPEIIDRMIFELDRPENGELARWLLSFMKEKIESNRGWSIKADIAELAGEIFNETYKSLPLDEREKIHDKAHLDGYKKTLGAMVRSFEAELKEAARRAVGVMDGAGLHYSDFKWGKNSGFSFFVRAANGVVAKPSARFIGLADNLDEWCGKTTPADKRVAIETAYGQGLNDGVKEVLAIFEGYSVYVSARIVLNYFYTLGILNDVQRRLQDFQRENNTLFLSDAAELLNKVIDNSDAPFVYEKTGTRINNYMIDEFQDTSAMQWENFRPLLRESLAGNHFNLIVGDVKQSIYRWRNSDWRLLEEQVPSDFEARSIAMHSLEDNWRSDERIVYFNNALFELGARVLQDDFNRALESLPDDEFKQYVSRKILDAYSHVHQRTPARKQLGEGHVRISFLSNEKGDEEGWKQRVLEQLPEDIGRLQEQGFSPRDIAVVVRWNHEAVAVAEALLKYKEDHPESPYRYDIISNEALVIGNAQSIKAMIALLRHFRFPADETKKMLAVYEFSRLYGRLSPEASLQNCFAAEAPSDFPDEIKGELYRMASLPLYELAETFFLLLNDCLDEKENAYVQAFLDTALKFGANTSSDTNDFLDWWDDKGCRKALFSPDNQDAIRLITIHKSKGLGFNVVLMPFVHWDVDHNPHHSDIIWCRPSCAPFNQLSIVPLRYSSKLVDSIFRNDYLQERLFTFVDNLNLLYVAFTRAKHCIIAYSPRPDGNGKGGIRNVSELLWSALSLPEFATHDGGKLLGKYTLTEGGDESVFELGTPSRQSLRQEAAPIYKTGKWNSVPFGNRLRMRLNSFDYFSSTGTREYGVLMHRILAEVETVDDVAVAVERAVSEGEIGVEEKAGLLSSLHAALSIGEAPDWYSGKYRVMNEVQILHPVYGFSRPDRVMQREEDGTVIVVDYKFGNLEEAKYVRQVRRYMKYIEEMDMFESVEGYLFYVTLQKIIKC